MAGADSFISPSGYELPLATPWFDIHHCPFQLIAWPSPSDLHTQWLDKVVVEKGEEWKKIGIFNMILLLKKEIPPNFGLLYGFFSFWNISVNAFYLSFGMISPTLHDVAAIIHLPVDEDKVLYLHDDLGTDLGYQVNKKNNAYSPSSTPLIREVAL